MAIFGFHHLHSQLLEHHGRQRAIDHIVINQQHAAGHLPKTHWTGRRTRWQLVARRRRRGRQRQVEAKGRPQTDGGLDVDRAPHRLDQTAADRQTQAGAAKAPLIRHVGLDKRIEDRLQVAPGDAHTRVDDFKADRCWRRWLDLGARPHAQVDAAALSEFDRVADQVQQHLAQSHLIGNDADGQAIVPIKAELQPLALRARGEQPQRRGNELTQRYRLTLDLEFAGSDLGEIEHVVDDRKQRLARRRGGLQQVLLAGGERRAIEQFECAEQPIHRRAQFVAHVGEKPLLGAPRIECGVARGSQLARALGDAMLQIGVQI